MGLGSLILPYKNDWDSCWAANRISYFYKKLHGMDIFRVSSEPRFFLPR